MEAAPAADWDPISKQFAVNIKSTLRKRRLVNLDGNNNDDERHDGHDDDNNDNDNGDHQGGGNLNGGAALVAAQWEV